MAHKGYTHPPGTPSAMKREFEFPKFNFQPDPEGLKRTFTSPGYRGKTGIGTGKSAAKQQYKRRRRLVRSGKIPQKGIWV
jgi:hypothetical protein|tara:strand:+ start:312 stop:551 length:240 start_codon:yes stop_codon:yes gene_type:complete